MNAERIFAAGQAATDVVRVQYVPTLTDLAARHGHTALSGSYEDHLAAFRWGTGRVVAIGTWEAAEVKALRDYFPDSRPWFFTGETFSHEVALFLDKDARPATVILDRTQNQSTFETWWPNLAPGGAYLAEGPWGAFTREHWDEFGIGKMVLHPDMMAFYKSLV